MVDVGGYVKLPDRRSIQDGEDRALIKEVDYMTACIWQHSGKQPGPDAKANHRDDPGSKWVESKFNLDKREFSNIEQKH